MKPIQMQPRRVTAPTHMDAKPDQAQPSSEQRTKQQQHAQDRNEMPGDKCEEVPRHGSARNRAEQGAWPRTLAPRGRDTSARSRQDDWPVCVWAWTAGMSRPGCSISYPAVWPRGSLPPSTILNLPIVPSIGGCVVSSSSWRLESECEWAACVREDLSGDERAWRRANSGCRVRGVVVVSDRTRVRLPGLDFEQATAFYRRFLGVCVCFGPQLVTRGGFCVLVFSFVAGF